MTTLFQRRFRTPIQSLVLCAAAFLFGVLGAAAAGAQPGPVDPPGRVARVSDLSGQAWIYSPDSGDWIAAQRNQPLTGGDRLATDPGARAELQIGSTIVRLDSGSELEVLELDDDRLALQLHSGSAAARVRDLEGAGEFELSTDEGRFVVQRAGSYRFDRHETKSEITVYTGLARYEGPNSGVAVHAGQRTEFWIDSGGVAQYSVGAPLNDAFAGWNHDRDRRIGSSVSSRYVSPEMTGADELDRYGRWEQNPEYGALWIPTAVAIDWAPYSHGHWAWVQPWGWTWVDDAPWGFAPFHYGRWVHVRNHWCWTPGVRVRRPVYAPALVAWIGGPRASVSISIGGGGPAVGWFPLAPREVYVPAYRSSPRYVQNINITNVTNITQITNVINNPQQPREFQNRRFPRAITVVPAGVMTERRPVAPAAAQLRQTPWVREFANQPGRASALPAPPVAAPVAPARTADPAAIRPPPGVAERPAGRPGFGPRERSEAERRGRSGERAELPAPAARPAVAAPAAAPPVAPVAPAAVPVTPPPPRAVVTPAVPPAQGRPGFDDADRRSEPRPGRPGRGPQGRDNAERGPAAVTPQAVAPVAPPVAAAARPAAAPPAPEAPMMRPLPVQRGEGRREESPGDDRRGPERRVSPRPEAVPAADARQGQRVERPPAAMPAPRPVEVPPVARPAEVQRPMPRPVEVQRPVPRPAEVQHPAPAAAPPPPPPEVRRPNPRERAEAAKDEPPRRGGEPQREQR